MVLGCAQPVASALGWVLAPQCTYVQGWACEVCGLLGTLRQALGLCPPPSDAPTHTIFLPRGRTVCGDPSAGPGCCHGPRATLQGASARKLVPWTPGTRAQSTAEPLGGSASLRVGAYQMCASCCTPVLPALWEAEAGGCNFKPSLGNTARCCVKMNREVSAEALFNPKSK